jgi:D-sedoheptulose 7-phosphate isomerase
MDSMDKGTFSEKYLAEVAEVAKGIDTKMVEKAVELLVKVRERGGRVFILGVGGSAGNASHAVNDLRKIAGIEAYAPTDNVSELTARTNDDGWNSVFEPWLKTSRLNSKDAVLVLSVGGGDEEKQISANLVYALKYAKAVNAKILGIVGRGTGYTAKVADACVVVPTVSPDRVTPHSESFQAVIWHLFVFHPSLKIIQGKWESITNVGPGWAKK